MPEEPTGNRLIAKNATMLYLRMFVTMAISFYTSRVVLKALGVSDYGIYNVVGGVIVMISTLTGALGGATSRFLTFALGKKDMENLKITFSTAFYIHLALAALFVIVAESVGVWFVNTQLVIPEGRMGAANWVFQAVIVSTALGMTQTPYSASITSHEKMATFAYIAILNAVLKLGIAFVVLIAPTDHLKLYSILLMAMSIGFQLYYRFYCIRHFEECHITRRFDKKIFKEMLSFSGWSMVGSLSLMVSQQGTNILINRFFGTILNAAVGVAGQVQGILSAFTGNIPVAFTPQITKEFAGKNFNRVNELIMMGTKLTGTITILLSIPVMINMGYLMSLWLDVVPTGAVVICEILLVRNIFNSFNPFVSCAVNATGKIKWINIFFSSLYLFSLLLSYIILKLTGSYVIMFIVGTFSSMISLYVYAYQLRRHMPSFKFRLFFFSTYVPLIVTAILAYVASLLLSTLFASAFVQLIVTSLVSMSIVTLVSFYIVMDKNTREATVGIIKTRILKK